MHILVGGPVHAWKGFLACDDQKKSWVFLGCIHVFDLVLKYGSDMNEGNWLQLLFLLHCIDGSSCLRHWNEFFLSCVSGFGLKFSRIELWRKRLQFDSESDLVFNGLIFGFFVRKWPPSLTSYLYGLKSAKTAQLLFDFQDIKIFRCLVWGVFWSVLQKCLYFFAVGFCKIDWYVLGRQYNFPLYAFVSSSLFFLEVVVKLFDYFWKPNSLFCKFCVTCLLMYYFVYC